MTLLSLCSAGAVPVLCFPLKALCSCITLPAAIVPRLPPVVKTKLTLETTLKTSWENKLPLKVIFLLPLWYISNVSRPKIVGTATVIRIGICWMRYSRVISFYWLVSVFFPPACATVEPAEVTLSGSSTAVEGQDLTLNCYATSSNPPVHIRWWLGYKELNTSVATMEEVGPHITQ